MEKRLYFIIHPIGALIGSQLDPQAFAEHYKFGSVKHFEGKIVFAEIDINYRNAYFDIEQILKQVVPHEEDGRPKATKFIKTYRVLEHIDLSAIKNVFLVNANSSLLALEKHTLDPTREEGIIRLYSEINPLKYLTLSNLNYQAFGQYITSDSTKSAPTIAFTQLELDADEFLEGIQKNPLFISPIHGVHPVNLKDAILEMKASPDKKTKGLTLNASLDSISYKLIRHGIMFSNQQETILYKMPPLREIEDKHIKFWKAL